MGQRHLSKKVLVDADFKKIELNFVELYALGLGGGGGPLETIFKTKVTLSAAQIKNLGTTPITVIPAPGAGKYIKILSSTTKLNWGTVAFDNNIIQLEFVGGDVLSVCSPLMGGTADLHQIDALSEWSTTVTISSNTAVQISGTDSVATGDSTVDVYITYEIITL